MWTAPPPAWNQTIQGTDAANIQTAVMHVLNGSTNVPVRWGFTLLDGQYVLQSFFKIGAENIGYIHHKNPNVFDRDEFRTRFSIDKSGDFFTLTINELTERENATFQCKILLQDGSEWAYKIRIEVTGTTRSCSALTRLQPLSQQLFQDRH